MSEGSDIANLMTRYPTAHDDVKAVPEPTWKDASTSLEHVQPKGVQRAISRFSSRSAEAVYNDSFLEGITYTEPEVVQLLGGTHIPGHTEGERLQVADISRAAKYLVAQASESPIEPGQGISDDLHVFIGASLGVAIPFRGDQRERYDGPQVRLDRGETFRALDARLTHAVLDAGLQRIGDISHPVARGATWAAFAAYEQFYFDGNKRTGRYVMNAVALSHGYDAILIPAARKADYEDVVVDALRTGDLNSHISFLLSLYDDR